MKRTTIVLTDELAKVLTHEARRKQMSMSALVRTLLEASLSSRRRTRKVPWAGIFDDPGMVTGDSVDDELGKTWAHDIESDR